MLTILVPVDGSRNALQAVRNAINECRRHPEVELHLLNVQPPLPRHIERFVSRRELDGWHHDRAHAAMAGARSELQRAGVPHQTHWVVGDRALEICLTAKRLGAHRIVIGAARKNSLTRMLEDSVNHRVLEAAPVPVEVVAGDSVSTWERWGLPTAVLGAGSSLLWLAID